MSFCNVTGERRDDGTVRIRLEGDLDSFQVPGLRRSLAGLLAGPLRCVELDLSGLSFCDVAGMRELLALRERGREQGFDVLLVSAGPAVRLMLRLCGIEDWLRDAGR